MRRKEELLLYFFSLVRGKGYCAVIFGNGSVGIKMDGMVRMKFRAVIN